MQFLGDYAEFARPKGAKDKKPRKRRMLRNAAIAAGTIGGSAGIGSVAGGLVARGGLGRNAGRSKTFRDISNAYADKAAGMDKGWTKTQKRYLARDYGEMANEIAKGPMKESEAFGRQFSRVKRRQENVMRGFDQLTAKRISKGAKKGALAGAALGAGGYGVYRGVKALRNSKRRK